MELLNPVQARVLAALVEKAATTPQYYPLTVNGAMLAANQKNARHPLMQLSEGEVGAALNQLAGMHLAQRDDRAGRVPKWRHQMQHELLLKPAQVAVLATLMLRGPQTLAELRANAAPLGGPEGADGLVAVLEALRDRAQPLVVELPRQPGQAASRHAHCLCGAPSAEDLAPRETPIRRATGSVDPTRLDELEARIAALEARMDALQGDRRD
jgi:Uncharacterized protein conserved in bacteria